MRLQSIKRYNVRINRRRLALPHVVFSTLTILSGVVAVSAQDMDHHSKPVILSTQLQIKGLHGESITLSPEEFAALPHKTVSVFNSHTKANETYSGVPLTALLAKVGVPLGEHVKGKLFLTGVVAEATDNYGVLFALAEIDPSNQTGDVLVADSIGEHKLEKDGAFTMISTEEKRPARSVRNLSSIAVIEVKP